MMTDGAFAGHEQTGRDRDAFRPRRAAHTIVFMRGSAAISAVSAPVPLSGR